MIGQISIFEILDKPVMGHEAEWLKGHGFINVYDMQPPQAGLYEWADIECPTKFKKFEVTDSGSVILGHLAMGNFRACWWRPIQVKGGM